MASGTIKRSGNCIATYYYISASQTMHLPKFTNSGVLFLSTNNVIDIYIMRQTHIGSAFGTSIMASVTIGTDSLDIVANNSCTCIYLHD